MRASGMNAAATRVKISGSRMKLSARATSGRARAKVKHVSVRDVQLEAIDRDYGCEQQTP